MESICWAHISWGEVCLDVDGVALEIINKISIIKRFQWKSRKMFGKDIFDCVKIFFDMNVKTQRGNLSPKTKFYRALIRQKKPFRRYEVTFLLPLPLGYQKKCFKAKLMLIYQIIKFGTKYPNLWLGSDPLMTRFDPNPFLQGNWPYEVACIYQDKVFLPLLFLMQVVYGCCVEAMIEATTGSGGR